jgi:hypothetical protein
MGGGRAGDCGDQHADDGTGGRDRPITAAAHPSMIHYCPNTTRRTWVTSQQTDRGGDNAAGGMERNA